MQRHFGLPSPTFEGPRVQVPSGHSPPGTASPHSHSSALLPAPNGLAPPIDVVTASRTATVSPVPSSRTQTPTLLEVPPSQHPACSTAAPGQKRKKLRVRIPVEADIDEGKLVSAESLNDSKPSQWRRSPLDPTTIPTEEVVLIYDLYFDPFGDARGTDEGDPCLEGTEAERPESL